MWRLCARCLLLLCTVLDARAVCDNGRFNIDVDVPDKSAYLCAEEYWPPPEVLPSISTSYKEENSYHACMDTKIEYTSRIPNSGMHRPKWAKYGEYIYCPPQRWVHNLKKGGVSFLYHPCVNPQLKEELAKVARSSMYKHIITPLKSLSRDRPIALAAWCATLEMSRLRLNEVRDWLQANVYQQHDRGKNGYYQHLLIQPSLMMFDKGARSGNHTEVLSNSFLNLGKWFSKAHPKKRRAVSFRGSLLPVTPVAEVTAKQSQNVFESHKTNLSDAGTVVSSTTKTERVEPASLAASPMPEQEGHLGGTGGSIQSTGFNKTADSSVPEPPGLKEIPVLGNNSQHSNKESPPIENRENTFVKFEDNEERPLPSTPSQELNASKYLDNHVNAVQKDNVGKPDVGNSEKWTDQPPKALPATPPKSLENNTGAKKECICQHEPTPPPPAAQKRSGTGLHKSSDDYLLTPRSEDAAWAAASLIFLFVLLTICVLYTQIYKKFRKSQSLYWASERHSEETETVASVIKRRLIQGHSKRKKWISRKKSPVLLYESLSESSD
ncbi:tumor protein p53-inducible protein 13 [Spea bombifrons]|uniref:tumor protein p53-inducible protein 13 n=1 Tax=Spea bombifrons TaxID=233779 RepID=UPI0023498619|nr:tumor protein p53-inducible protein 13 [Spea bombifrons]